MAIKTTTRVKNATKITARVKHAISSFGRIRNNKGVVFTIKPRANGYVQLAAPHVVQCQNC